MSLASQQEVPTYADEQNPTSYATHAADMGGRRASEATYPTPARYDRSNNVRNKKQFDYLC